MDYRTYFRDYPDKNGRFGEYGGVYLPPQLVPVFEEIIIKHMDGVISAENLQAIAKGVLLSTRVPDNIKKLFK